jgi:hypothetical protein
VRERVGEKGTERDAKSKENSKNESAGEDETETNT